MSSSPAIRPASTVVLLRDGDAGIETLLLKRNKALNFAGGFWVFPGGSLDPEDLEQASGDEEQASRLAACREAREECGQCPHPEDMILLSHWTTPEAEKKRFSTLSENIANTNRASPRTTESPCCKPISWMLYPSRPIILPKSA